MISRQAMRLLSRPRRVRILPAAATSLSPSAIGIQATAELPLSERGVPSWDRRVLLDTMLTPGVIQQRWFSSTSEEKTESGETKPPSSSSPTDESPPEAEETTGPSKEETLQAEIKTLKDQLLRSYAEQENTRNIARRDVAEARQFAIKSFAKSLLEVSDNLQRALDSVPTDDLTSNAQLKLLHEGIEMTNTGLLKALEANGVKKYCETPGDKFDPELHNALMQYADPTKEPDTVGQVIKVGFTLNNRVLRPAEVGVIKKP